MAYGQACSTSAPPWACEVLHTLSSPHVSAFGSAMGNPSTADNACVVQQLGPLVASYDRVVAGSEDYDKVRLAPTCPWELTTTRAPGGRVCVSSELGQVVEHDQALEVYRGCAEIRGSLTVGGSVSSLRSLTGVRRITRAP